MQKTIIANFKMNNNLSKTTELLKFYNESFGNDTNNLVMCVPYVYLFKAKEILKNSHIKIGAQNLHEQEEGAFTGEISAEMLKDFGVEYVLIGHSERRKMFYENTADCSNKIATAIKNNIIPVLCVGENEAQKQDGLTEKIVRKQVNGALKKLSINDLRKVIVAYEPIWSIGTGCVPTKEEVSKVAELVQKTIEKLSKQEIKAQDVNVLYGGSVNEKNVKEFINVPSINGVLVGGVSLKAQEFFSLVKNCE